MSALGSLFRHSFSYLTGHLIVLAAGLISLPLMTRLLPKEDYGLMSLVFLAITIATSICALGFPQSTTRYFSEYAERGPRALMRFCSTMLLGVAAAGTIASIALFVVSTVMSGTSSFGTMASHLRYAVVLVLIRLASSVCLQILRGNHQTVAFNLFNVVNRYLTIAIIVLLLVFVRRNVSAVFAGTIIVESALLLAVLAYFWRRGLIGWAQPDTSAITRAIRFGVPLVIADLMVSLIASSDRFAIQFFLDANSVAVYSVGYDVSDYVATIFAKPLQLAILPIVYSLWSSHGIKATQQFLSKSISLSIVVIIPMIVGFAIVGPDIVIALASEKYAESGPLIPIIGLGVILGSVNFLLFTGLLLHEKTRIVTMLNGFAAIMNLALNLILIPRTGVVGAAYATVLTYALLNVSTYVVSGRYLRVAIDSRMILKALIATSIMALAIIYLPDVSRFRIINALTRAILGAALYLGLMASIESRVRDIGIAALSKLGAARK